MAMTWGMAQKRKMSLSRSCSMYCRQCGACLPRDPACPPRQTFILTSPELPASSDPCVQLFKSWTHMGTLYIAKHEV